MFTLLASLRIFSFGSSATRYNAPVQTLPLLTAAQATSALLASREKDNPRYYAFYSSLLGGIVRDPGLMVIPMDDHLAHRGDGVFETLKCVAGGIYLWREHVQRLTHSAEAVGLPLPWSAETLAEITAQTIRAGGQPDCLVRLIVSRGPGSLGINPYDCPTPGLYILAYELKPSFMEAHPTGATVISSAQPVKSGFFATIKTCNYLPNALLKKEAADRGADFALAFDEQGNLAEGATENLGIVDATGALRVPGPARILSGTTMNRVVELAQALVATGQVRTIARGPISKSELATARELLIFGTTPDVTSAISLDGTPIAGGRPGPIGTALLALIQCDIRDNPTVRLQVV